MKDGILTAFDSVVSSARRGSQAFRGQRQMPGWNFCTYFILKVRFSYHSKTNPLIDVPLYQESLASLFEGMSLLDDALAQYDELEATFFKSFERKICHGSEH